MLKKVSGLASLLLLFILLGAACAPAASQKELLELQYQVQALRFSLASTQSNLEATQQALQNLQNQNQQLQNQAQQVSSKCTTCEKTAQSCVINPYGYVTTSNYCYNPCPTRCMPIGYSPCRWTCPYCFNPHPYGSPCGHGKHHPPVGPNPSPTPPPPPPPPPVQPQMVSFPHPVTPDSISLNTPATEPTFTDLIILYGLPLTIPRETTPPAVMEPPPSPQPELVTFITPVAVPEPVLKPIPSAPVNPEPATITEVIKEAPAEPQVMMDPRIALELELMTNTTPANVFQSAPVTVESPLEITQPQATAAVPAMNTPQISQPVGTVNNYISEMATLGIPLPAITPEQTTKIAAPATTAYPVVTAVPTLPALPLPQVTDTTDEQKNNTAL